MTVPQPGEGEDGLDLLRPPPSRSSLVASAIKEAILSNQLTEGASLIERDLAAKLGVSKTPVREALISLTGTGLVSVQPNRRMVVAAVTESDVEDVHELRLLIEPHAIVEGLDRWSLETFEQATALLERARTLSDPQSWPELSLVNRRFHRLLYARCENQLLVETLDRLQDRVALMAVRNWERRPTWGAEQQEHQDILEAIRERDAASVLDRVRRHISGFTAFTASLRGGESSGA